MSKDMGELTAKHIIGVLIVLVMVACFAGGWIVGHDNPIVKYQSPNATTLNSIRLNAVYNYTDNIANAQQIDAVYDCPYNKSVALTIAMIRPIAPNGTIMNFDAKLFRNVAYTLISNGSNRTYEQCDFSISKIVPFNYTNVTT